MRQPLPSFTGGDGGGSLFVHRSEVLASTVIGTLLVHAKGVPGSRTEDVCIGDIMHANRDAKDGA